MLSMTHALKTISLDKTAIRLSDTERQIFDLILRVRQDNGLSNCPRVAGGWIRDKLRGKESDDIDIALDGITGAAFGKFLTKDTGGICHVIKANPEQSKHLETATVNLFGIDIDFANL